MDLISLVLLILFYVESGESGGHGGKHHDHVKVHIPEFVHHDLHTKVVTIHHHHHKPKKEQHHHHHHHHHHKPHGGGHHFHHHNKKTHILHTTTTKGHQGHQGHHGHHGHHGSHGHRSHHGHHGHEHHGHYGQHGHEHGHHHHDAPVTSYDPPAVSSFEDDFGSSFSPSVPSYGGGIVAQTPQVHGISHTIKQVKVYDSLPGVIPTSGSTASNGYEVTEQGEEDDDVFTSVNGFQQAYPATYGYLRAAAPEPSHDPFASLSPQSTIQSNNHDPFAVAPAPTLSLTGGEQFIGKDQSDLFTPLYPSQEAAFPSDHGSPEFPVNFQEESGFDDPANTFVGDVGSTAMFAKEDKGISEETPVTFDREAGIQHSINTGGVETVVY